MNFIRAIFGGVRELSPRDYHKQYDDSSHFLLDVRNPNEYDSEHIEGAVNIPLNKLPKKLKSIPKDQPVICVSRDGLRGREATELLGKAGFDAANLAGGVLAWRKNGNKVVS